MTTNTQLAAGDVVQYTDAYLERHGCWVNEDPSDAPFMRGHVKRRQLDGTIEVLWENHTLVSVWPSEIELAEPRQPVQP